MASHSRMVDRSNPADLRKGVVGDVRLLDDGTPPSDPWRIVDSHSSTAALEALCDGVGCSSLFEDAGERALSERRRRTGRMQDDARGDALNAADPALGSDPPLVRRLKEVVLTGPRFDAAEADVHGNSGCRAGRFAAGSVSWERRTHGRWLKSGSHLPSGVLRIPA